MSHPVVHTEIRSEDPDATRKFFLDLFGWKVASEGAFPGYTFIDTGAEGGPYVAISPRQGTEDEVLFFVSDEKYTRVQTATVEALIRKPIKELVDELDPQAFWQIHRSTLVNV